MRKEYLWDNARKQANTFQARTRDRNFEVGRLQACKNIASRRASTKGRKMLKAILDMQIELVKAEQVYDKAIQLNQRQRGEDYCNGRPETRVVWIT